jgi:hypothetical protein
LPPTATRLRSRKIKAELRDWLPSSLAKYPNCTVVQTPRSRDDRLKRFSEQARRARDYARYHEPVFWGASENRRRALDVLVRDLPRQTRQIARATPDFLLRLNDPEIAAMRQFFEQIESLIPSSPVFERFIESHRPDLMLVSPLVSLGSRQVEFVKAARVLGVPSALLTFSWDNLSNKGVMHVRPDRVFVWNAIQQREAVELHDVDASRVTVTGAPRFDPFYRMTPAMPRGAFCRTHGLDPAYPLIVYLGSSPVVSPNEPVFVERWVDAIRHAPDSDLRNAQILIRPHPRHKEAWKEHPRFKRSWHGSAIQPFPNVALMLAGSVNADQTLFDVLSHGDVVAALNTSAELEAGILGKPVYTVRSPEHAPGQVGSLHFHYLLKSQGGFVEAADTLDEHVDQLQSGLRGDYDRAHQRQFVREFVRPRGEELPVSPILANEISAMLRPVLLSPAGDLGRG